MKGKGALQPELSTQEIKLLKPDKLLLSNQTPFIRPVLVERTPVQVPDRRSVHQFLDVFHAFPLVL